MIFSSVFFIFIFLPLTSVSYTHLDVYKRQGEGRALSPDQFQAIAAHVSPTGIFLPGRLIEEFFVQVSVHGKPVEGGDLSFDE